jgi:hypothetical protein
MSVVMTLAIVAQKYAFDAAEVLKQCSKDPRFAAASEMA